MYKKSRPAVAASLTVFMLSALAAACPMPERNAMADAEVMAAAAPDAMPGDCGAMHHGKSATQSPADGMDAFCNARIQFDSSIVCPQVPFDAPQFAGDAIAAVVPAFRLPHGTVGGAANVLLRPPGTSVLLKHSVIRI